LNGQRDVAPPRASAGAAPEQDRQQFEQFRSWLKRNSAGR
jgi:hypothetical protein